VGYVDRQLEPGEEIVFRTDLHAVVFAGVLGLAAVVVGVVALIIARNDLASQTMRTLWLVAALVIALAALPRWLRWRCGEFAVTTRRLLARVGLRSRDTFALALGTVDGIGLERTIGGRLLGYGTVQVQIDADVLEFHRVARAEALCEAIRRQATPTRRTKRAT